MKAKLISYTQPTKEFIEETNIKEVAELIDYCARVSNPSNQLNNAPSQKLLEYCIRNSHWSIFEMANVCIEIDTTRDIAHQIIRHASFRFQEFSQRYSDPAEFGNQFVIREARLQDVKNRQNSIETDDIALQAWWDAQQKFMIESAKRIYQEAIERGIAKEQARVILPEGNTKTRLYMNGTLRSWVHYIELRSGNGTQKEHMEVARAVAEAISKIFPMINDFIE